MSVKSFFRVFLAALVLALAPSPSAHAQTSQQVAAEALFREARKLVDEDRYAEACEKFAASQKLEAAVGTLLNLGRCYEKIGRTASAWATYHEAIAAANGTGQLDRAETAKLRAAALEPSLSRLTIVVSPEVSAMKPEITRDRELVPSEVWGVTVPVDAGEHLVQVTARGRKPWATTAKVQPRETATVPVPVLEADDVVPGTWGSTMAALDPATTSNADTPSRRWSGKKTGALVLAGFAAAGATLAVVEGLRYLDKKSAAENACPYPCTSEENRNASIAYRDEAKEALILEFVGIGVGAAALVGATVLWLTDGEHATNTAQVFPLVGTREVGLGVGGRW